MIRQHRAGDRIRLPPALLALAALGLIALSPGAGAEPEVKSRHQDWTVICDTPEGQSAERCSIIQALSHKDTKQQVLRMEVGYLGDSTQLIAIITLPLGVALPQGVKMKIDEQEARQYQFGQCIPAGCIVGVQVTEEQLALFKSGSTARITFQDNLQRPVTLPVSLRGFTAAFGAIKK